MPKIKCKEKEGQADSCKRDIIYQLPVISVLGTSAAGGGAEATTPNTDVRYLTLICLDGHIHNYEVNSKK